VTPRACLASWPRRLALAAFLLLMFRAWIPAGFMPGPDGSLILCPGTADAIASAAQVSHGANGHHRHHEGQQEKTAGAPCPFAIASAAASPPAPVALTAPPDPSAAPIAAPAAQKVSSDFPNLRPPSTGPPARL